MIPQTLASNTGAAIMSVRIAVVAGVAVFAIGLLSGASPPAGEKTNVNVWNAEGGEKDEALTLKPDLENGKVVYEVCLACHLPEGWGSKDGTFPQIAGQHRKVIIKQLADIRALNRDNPTMYPFALPKEIGGVQALADVSEYIAKLPMTPDNGVGPGKDVAHGEKLYKENCVRCHGEQGEGNEEKWYPLIQGQHYEYLIRQFREIKSGKRRNSNPEMVQQIKGFSERDIDAVMDFTSRLKPPKERVAPLGWQNPDFK
jgi:cytochrome c553